MSERFKTTEVFFKLTCTRGQDIKELLLYYIIYIYIYIRT